MARVYVVNEDKWIEVPDGSRLIVLDGKTNIPFACSEGVCGSCLVTVRKGIENLEPPDEIEAASLQSFATSPNQRLMCRAVIKGGEIEIEY